MQPLFSLNLAFFCFYLNSWLKLLQSSSFCPLLCLTWWARCISGKGRGRPGLCSMLVEELDQVWPLLWCLAPCYWTVARARSPRFESPLGHAFWSRPGKPTVPWIPFREEMKRDSFCNSLLRNFLACQIRAGSGQSQGPHLCCKNTEVERHRRRRLEHRSWLMHSAQAKQHLACFSEMRAG